VNPPYQIAVFVSGSGTNLQALLDRFSETSGGVARVSRVVASRPGIGAIARAEQAGVPWSVLPAGVDSGSLAAAMLAELEIAEADLLVLAGFLKLIPEAVVRAYRGRILNIHPALLPAFGGPGMYGRRVHEAVLASGARISGATVHVVDEQYDHGPIVAQWPVPVLEGDEVETLAGRVLEVEHRLLPDVVEAFATGDLTTDPAGRPEWRRPLFRDDRFGLVPPKR
jgi:phosphoribosylglycinamide formyltransferase-1